jgi:PST family polysaccharide transporter
MRMLVSPLIVAPLTDARTVGCVALAVRIGDMLSFLRPITARVVTAGLARIQDERERFRRVIEEGMRLYVLAFGSVLLAFALGGLPILARFFGPEWELVGRLYPFIAVGALADALFQMPTAALHVLRRSWVVAALAAVRLALLAGAAAVLIQGWGGMGRGWAEIVALAGYGATHARMMEILGPLEYRDAALWTAAIAVGLFTPAVGPAALVPLGLVLLWPGTWASLRRVWRTLPAATSAR